MPIDIETGKGWSETLLTYGPYAISVLALVVAFVLLKLWYSCAKDDPEKRRFCKRLAAGSWIFAAITAGYIIYEWDPTKVYPGSFGSFPEDVRISTKSDKMYISSIVSQGLGRALWKFAFVGALAEKDVACNFTIERPNKTTSLTDYEDYHIPVKLLKEGPLTFVPDSSDPLILKYKQGDSFIEYPYKGVVARRLKMIHPGLMSAYAQGGNTEILSFLNSPNPSFRLEGRIRLQRLTDAEFQNLCRQIQQPLPAGTTPQLNAQARQYIKDEAARRGLPIP